LYGSVTDADFYFFREIARGSRNAIITSGLDKPTVFLSISLRYENVFLNDLTNRSTNATLKKKKKKKKKFFFN